MLLYLLHATPFLLLFTTMAAFSFMPGLTVYLPFSKYLMVSPYISGMAVMISCLLMIARMYGYIKNKNALRLLMMSEILMLGNFVFGPMQLTASNYLPDCFWTALAIMACDAVILFGSFNPNTPSLQAAPGSAMLPAVQYAYDHQIASAGQYPALPPGQAPVPYYDTTYQIGSPVYQLETKKNKR